MKIICFAFALLIILTSVSCKKEKDHNDTINNTLQNGLLAYYPFNTNTKDESSNGYDLQNYGAIPTINRFGEQNKAFHFDGLSYMQIPGLAKADSLRELTISLWAKPDYSGHQSMISFLPRPESTCNSYLGFDNSENNYRVYHEWVHLQTPNNCVAATIQNNINNPIGNWCHIVFIQKYNSSNPSRGYTYLSYFNNARLKDAESAFGYVVDPVSFYRGGIVGGCNNIGDPFYNFDLFIGSIDDIRIYNRALSDTEINALFLLHE